MTEIKYRNITIRTACTEDVSQLAAWWNDGTVMAHAGFPLGLGTNEAEVATGLGEGTFIIEENCRPIGECNFRPVGDSTAEIGIKLCEKSSQNRGLGKIVLSLFIRRIFDRGFERIVLDTNLANTRAQHVYEQLGFKKLRVNLNSWCDQLGQLQSSVDYELTEANFVDFTHIQTPRLTLRPFSVVDLADLHEIFSDADTMAHIEPPFSIEKTEEFLLSFCIKRGAALACVHRESGKMIGYLLFNATEPDVYKMGWIFNRAHWRQAYAFEACSALLSHAFEQLGAKKVFAETTDAEKSLPLMKKLGLRYVGSEDGMHICSLTREEYDDKRDN